MSFYIVIINYFKFKDLFNIRNLEEEAKQIAKEHHAFIKQKLYSHEVFDYHIDEIFTFD